MKKYTHIACLFLVTAMVLGMAVGCNANPGSSAAGPGTAGSAGAKEDTLVIAVQDETPSVGTMDHDALAGDNVNRLVYNGLFKTDDNLNPIPDLCKDYTVENDANGEPTIWTFTLRDGVKFHDGTTMTAADVVATIMAAKESPNVMASTASIKTIEAVDDLTVRIVTDGPSASLLIDLCAHGNLILPKALLDGGNDFNKNPVGTGPYKFVKWTRGDRLEFEAFEDYFDAESKASIKNLVYKIIPEASSRTIALEAGEVDLVLDVLPTEMNRLMQDENIEVFMRPSLGLTALVLNNEVKPFDDVNVRKAINCAIDKQSINSALMNNIGAEAKSQCPIGILGENTEGFDAFDLEKAKSYMAAWGGDPSTIKLSIICSNDMKRSMAEIIQANLKEIGIHVEIESMDLATYMSVTAKGDFTGYIGGYAGASDMVKYLTVIFHSANINASNKGRINDPDIDRMITEAARTPDKDAREIILKEAVAYLNGLCPQVPLFQDTLLKAYNKELKNFSVDMNGKLYVNKLSW